MKRRVVLYMALVFASVCTPVRMLAGSGQSCGDPIVLTPDYTANIVGSGSKWYMANTFDLPLTVKFYPQSESDPIPDLYLDFSCTPGSYSNPIICNLFCDDGSAYITLPHHSTPDVRHDTEGNLYYEVAMGENYRDMLLEAGISENVAVYVEVRFYGGGSISVTPDAEFSSCMDGAKWLLLGKTHNVAPNDDSTAFIAPYANWTNDSVRFIWSGTAPARLTIGTVCDFDPKYADARLVDVMNLAPQDTANKTNADINYYVNFYTKSSSATSKAEGGIFYAKVASSAPGTLKVERMPMTPPEGGAEELEYDKPTSIPANGLTDALYAIPLTWTEATLFATPTRNVFKMYVGKTANFTPETAIATYQFNRNADGHWWGLTKAEMTALWAQTNKKYLYIRFECTQATTITPVLWTPSDCYTKTIDIVKDVNMNIESRSKVIYRIFYADWKDGDMSVSWNQNAVCKMLVSGDCSIGTSESAETVFYYEQLANKETALIPEIELADWAGYVDEDGYIYMRFYTQRNDGGVVRLSTTAPEETDPEGPDPEPEAYPTATVSVTCNGNKTASGQPYIIRVAAEQDLNLVGIETWHQTPAETHAVTLPDGTYTLQGAEETVRIKVE